jgi:TPR repeat protein
MAAVAALALWACGADAPDSGVEVLQYRAEKSTVGDTESAVGEDMATIRSRAESGDREAQYLLGRSLRTAETVTEGEAKEGLEWIRKSADQGWADAQFFLGRFSEHGECAPTKGAQAKKWWARYVDENCRDQGRMRTDANAQLVPADLASAVLWYRRASDQEHSAAQMALASMYAKGEGIQENDAAAIELMRRAAENGNSEIKFRVARLFDMGGTESGVAEDNIEAIKWYRLAAEQGHAEAQFNLGVMNDNGEGVPEDAVEAVNWYRLAAEQGHAVGQFNLGNMYRDGRGVTRNDVEAIKWFRLAAEQGDASAQNNLGLMYDIGEGVPNDDVEAVKWYRLAAEQGDAVAQYNLGQNYYEGEGVVQNDVEAVKWFRLAAEQGNAGAQNSLGVMYDKGEGVAENDVEAVKWYRLSAEQGDASAQYNLGVMYRLGVGVAKSNEAAYFWTSLAAASLDGFRETRDQIKALLTAEQVRRTQARTAEWVTAATFEEAKERLAGAAAPNPKPERVRPTPAPRPVALSPSPSGPPIIKTSDRDSDIAVATTSARLRASPGGEVLATIEAGKELALLGRAATDGWYEVIDIESGALGWIHESVVRLELASSPAPAAKIFQAQATGVDAPPEVKVENRANRTIWLRVGDQKYTIAPGQTLTVNVPAGSHRFNAWAAGVIPASGTESFNRGYTYNWAFWIKRL